MAENGLQVFENERFGNVRVVMRDGEPWFVAADVCNAFGVANSRNVTARLDVDEKDVHIVDTLGGKQNLTVVNEAGLYHMLFTMEPNNARGVDDAQINERVKILQSFKRWITHEVLPDIRKHGMYATTEVIDNMLSNPDVMIQLLTEYKQEKQLRKEAEKRIEEQKPLVEFAETVSKSADNILMRNMAKLMCQQHINIGEKRLYKLLRQHDVLMSDNEPYQSYIDRGYFQVKEGSYTTPYGTTILNNTTLVTPKGQIWLVGKVREWLETA